MPSTDITSRCCPDYYKCTRCDQSCFFKEVAYIATSALAGVDAAKVYVKSQFDDCDPAGTSGDKLGWFIDKSVTISSPPQGALILTGTSGSDFYEAVSPVPTGGDACDNILDESVAQDNQLWVVVCLCNKNDYFQILGGGSSPEKVDTAHNLQALKNKYNCNGDNHDDDCAKPQYFAFNVIGADIDGSPNNATNPLDVGDYITISGDLETVSGASAGVYGTPSGSTANATEAQLVGGGSDDLLRSATLSEDIFRVIDRTKQIQPGCTGSYVTRQAYPYPIAAYIANPVVKTHANGGTTAGSAYEYLENCQDCLQAYLGLMRGDANRTSKGLDDIIDITDTSYNQALDSCPSTWPCSVQITRTYSLDCTIAQNFGDQNNFARPVYPSARVPSDFSPDIVNGTICHDTSTNVDQGAQLSGLYYETDKKNSLEGHLMTDNIIGADRAMIGTDGLIVNQSSPTTITITAEYKRNIEIDQTPLKDSPCPNNTRINGTLDFDYTLNSVSVSTDVPSSKGTVVASILSPTQNQLHTGCVDPALIHAVQDVQGSACGLAGDQTSPGFITQRLKKSTTVNILDAPTRGLAIKEDVYKGRLYIQRPTGHVTPFYKYIGYFGNHLADVTVDENGNGSFSDGFPDNYLLPENDSSRFTEVERDIFRQDGVQIGKSIDEVIPFAPYLELAAGFNVNGFNHLHQETNDTIPGVSQGGRSDRQTITVDGLDYEVYPGNSNTSKITFGDAGTSGKSLTGLPFYFDSYCTALSSMQGSAAQAALAQYSDNVQNDNDTNRNFVSRGNQNFINAMENAALLHNPPRSVQNDGTYDIDSEDFCDDGNFRCKDIYRFSSDAHFIAACYNNEITRMNGSRTGDDGADDDDVIGGSVIFRYAGNGLNFKNSGLSGNSAEEIGIDSEWTQVYITAQDPWCRSCNGCISKVVPFTEGSPDNYLLIGDTGRQNRK